MNSEQRTPTAVQVMAAIARREIVLALRRRLLKALFIVNMVPALVMAVVLIVNSIAKGVGIENLGWDPLVTVLQYQAIPVFLLALGMGTPLIARDRSEDVLFLYATRPVTPWSYTMGKMFAVAIPAVALLVIPTIVIAIIRAGLMAEFGLFDSLTLIGKILITALVMAAGFAGVTVGPSAAAKKARWALLLAFMCFLIPSGVAETIWGGNSYALDPANATDRVIGALFERDDLNVGVAAAAVLVFWGLLGSLVTAGRVRKEMIP